MGNISNPINLVSPTTVSYNYCDPTDIIRRLSVAGTTLRLEDFGIDVAAGEVGAIDDAIWDATETINFYCQSLYRPEDMANSMWVNRRCTDIAIYNLFLRRGNAPPPSVDMQYKQTLALLEKIHEDRYEIPNLPVRFTRAPAWSNIRVDQFYPVQRLRVERSISEKSVTPYAQQIDWVAEFLITL